MRVESSATVGRLCNANQYRTDLFAERRRRDRLLVSPLPVDHRREFRLSTESHARTHKTSAGENDYQVRYKKGNAPTTPLPPHNQWRQHLYARYVRKEMVRQKGCIYPLIAGSRATLMNTAREKSRRRSMFALRQNGRPQRLVPTRPPLEARYAMVQSRQVVYGMERCREVRRGGVRCGEVRYSPVRAGTVRYRTATNKKGTAGLR